LKSNILVTGGAGFVGSHLIERLLSENYDITVVDDFSNGRMENIEKVKDMIKLIKCDISINYNDLLKQLNDKYEGIFNLACFPRSLSLQNPFRDLEVNARGTLNILEIAKKNKCKMVFTSNSGIYGNPEYLPIDEKHPDNPTTPYDANKLVSEYYMKIYYRIFQVPIAICRLATVYGERQRTKPEWKPVIPEFATRLLNNEPASITWDGEQTRDLIYVKDVVQGLVKAFKSDKTKDEAYLLSTDTEISINEIYNILCKVLNKNIPAIRTNQVAGDIRRMKLSYGKANKTFQYQPEYTMEQGINNYVEWLKSDASR
jgi:UDP-glucose 4-epimerase